MRDIYGTGAGEIELHIDETALAIIESKAITVLLNGTYKQQNTVRLFKSLRNYLLSRGLKVNWDINEKDRNDKT